MGLSAWNAYRARKAAEEQALGLVSTSPAESGEVETVQPEPEPIEVKAVEPEIEEPKPKKKRTK
jgi:hypothetical protein